MGTISMPQGRGNRKHNIRSYSKDKMPKNINREHTKENITWKDETVGHAYHRIFDQALTDYNNKQKRKDRKIINYHQHIINSKNGEKEFYEDILQWGSQEDFKENPECKEEAKKCLIKFIEGFEERNPNLNLIGAYIHMDEASPHMHFDYIPVAEGYKTGMQKRNSLDRAMKDIIKLRTGRSYSPRASERNAAGKCTDNATKQWKEMEREVFKQICMEHNLVVDKEVATPERDSLSVVDYKLQKRKEEVLNLDNKKNELEGEILNTVGVMKIDITKPLLGQKVKIAYTDYADLKETAEHVDDITKKASGMMTKAESMMKAATDKEQKAMEIIKNEKSIISKAKETAKKIIEDAIGQAASKFVEVINELKQQIQKLTGRKKELESEIQNVKRQKESLEKKIDEKLGIIPKKELYDSEKELQRCMNNAIPYLDQQLLDAVKRNDIETIKKADKNLYVFVREDIIKSHWLPGHKELSELVEAIEEHKRCIESPHSVEEVKEMLRKSRERKKVKVR